MTAQFTDDAYNKHLETSNLSATLIGNWYEEECIRDATGHGRTISQRHVKRSGLLQDFTKMPSSTQKMDNTFDRVYGHRQSAGDDGLPGSEAIHLPTAGLREKRDHAICVDYANAQVSSMEDARALAYEDREFGTTSDARDTAFPSNTAPAAFEKNSTSQQLTRGPKVPKEEMYANSGLDINLEQSYLQEVPVTFYTQVCGSGPNARSGLKVSAASGVSTFAKNSAFTMPIGVFPGQHQDEEVDMVLACATSDARHPKGGVVCSSIDTLTALKGAILDGIRARGLQGLANFRAELARMARANGCIPKDNVFTIFKELYPESNDAQLSLYLSQLCTMKKNEVQVIQLLKSLQQNVPNAIQARMHAAVESNWRPSDMQAPQEQAAFMQFLRDIYAMDPDAVEHMLP